RLRRLVIAPEQKPMRWLAGIESDVAGSVLFDCALDAPDAVRIGDFDLNRREHTNGCDRWIDLQLSAIRQSQQYKNRNNHQQDDDADQLFHFLVQVSIQSMKFLYQKMLFWGLSTQWPSSGNTINREGTFCNCSEVYNCRPCVYGRSEEHTSELQSPDHLVCRLLLEKKKKQTNQIIIYQII